MKYLLSDLSVRTREGIKCDFCKKKIWKGLHVRCLDDEDNELRICYGCSKYHIKEKIKKEFDDNGMIWIFDSRFYKSK